MNNIKVYAKAVAAFIATVVGNMVVNLVNGVAPWPHTTGQWVQFVVTSFTAAIATLITPAKISDKQIDKDPTVVRVDPPAEAPAPGGYHNPWKP